MNQHTRWQWIALWTPVVLASSLGCAGDETRGGRAGSITAGSGGAGAGGSTVGSAAGAGGSGFGNSDASTGGVGAPCVGCGQADAAVIGDGGVIVVPRTHVACDEALALDSSDARDGARAIGVCPGASSDDTGTGFLAAAYTDAVGATNPPPDALQVGLVERFGPIEPREGSRMLLLSSGVARAPDQPGYTDDCDSFNSELSTAPPGFPMQAPRCTAVNPFLPTVQPVVDPAALSLELQVPAGAVALSVDFNFYTSEFPTYVCATYNDFFVILVDPAPAGSAHGNVAFDIDGNSIGVNSSLLRACDPNAPVNPPFVFDCDLGTAPLAGTGFDEGLCLTAGPGGSTGWLTTTVAVTAGTTLRLRFAIWDAGDPGLDSSVLIDNFRFIGDDVIEAPPSTPITTPVVPD